MLTQTSAVTRFRDELRDGGIRPALKLLNEMGSHRFTAIYLFDGGVLRNFHLVDREDSSVTRCPDAPVLDSYCLYVRDTARLFMTEYALNDARVDGHPKQKVVQSYCGYPLQGPRGDLVGTVCHFDFAPVGFDEDEIAILEQVGPLLAEAVVQVIDSAPVNETS